MSQGILDMETPATSQELSTVGGTMNPLQLIERAVERGLDTEQLKALVDLQERWNANRAREEFAAAMNTCQQELPLIVKDANNAQTKSAYVRMETVQHLAKPVISKHGFSLSFGESDCPTADMKRTICDVRHSAGHCEQYHLDLPLDGVGAKGNAIGAMNRVQAAVSTGTYAQRYLTCRIFNITIAETDRDGAQLHANPGHREDAPKAAPRGQRQTPAANTMGVAMPDVSQIATTWKRDNKSLAEDKKAFADWVRDTTGREFDCRSLSAWTKPDVKKCQSALGIDEPSDIPW